jgi:hypothetical protein
MLFGMFKAWHFLENVREPREMQAADLEARNFVIGSCAT